MVVRGGRRRQSPSWTLPKCLPCHMPVSRYRARMRWRRPKRSVPELCGDLVEAVRDRNEQASIAVYRLLGAEVKKASAGNLTSGLEVLQPALAEVRIGDGGQLASLAGAFVELGADPFVTLETLVVRIAEGLEQAAAFPQLWEKITGESEPPSPGQPELTDAALRRIEEHAVTQRVALGEMMATAEAWFTVGEWAPGLLVPLQRTDIRLRLPHRPRLETAVDSTCEHIGSAHWMQGLLRVIDDEHILVLHRPSGRGYRMTIGGIGDNFQLHTLLAAALIGDPVDGMIPGASPDKRWVSAATDGQDMQPGGIAGQFNLVDGYGEWIWNEGRPIDIPLMDGHRVIVLDPPPYPRTWTTGRQYPLMKPTVKLDSVMEPEEATQWLDKVAPDQRSQSSPT